MADKIHTYRVAIEWKGNKRAVAKTDYGPQLEIGPPPDFGGGKEVWSPEHLLVASLNSCFTLTFMALAEKTKLPVEIQNIAVTGTLTQTEDRRWSFTHFLIEPKLKIPAPDQTKAKVLLDKAEKYCLISQSLKAGIAIEPEFVN